MKHTLQQMPGALFVVAAFAICAWAAAGPAAAVLTALAVSATLVWQHAQGSQQPRPARTQDQRRRGLELQRRDP